MNLLMNPEPACLSVARWTMEVSRPSGNPRRAARHGIRDEKEILMFLKQNRYVLESKEQDTARMVAPFFSYNLNYITNK